MQVTSIGPRPVWASETISVDNTAGGVGLTDTKIFKAVSDNNPGDRYGAKSAFFTVETDAIRVNFDPSVTVTATTNGHVFNAGDSFTVDGTQTLKTMKMIRVTSTASVKVTYFG